MQLALLDDALLRPRQTDATRALCPECQTEVTARRGGFTIDHWAHLPGQGEACDRRSESGGGGGSGSRGIQGFSSAIPGPRPGTGTWNETPWHAGWKARFVDVGELEKERGAHRTDVWTTIRGISNPGRAFEFQSRPIAMDLMRARQHAWINVVWVLRGDGEDVRPMDKSRGRWRQMSWRWVPEMVWKGINQWTGCGAQVYLDSCQGSMARVVEVEFGRGWDGGARVTAEIESTEKFVDRYRADASMPLIVPEVDVMGTCNKCSSPCVRYGVNGNPLCKPCLAALGR